MSPFEAVDQVNVRPPCLMNLFSCSPSRAGLASRTWLQTTGGSRPAHDGRYGAHHGPHPGVGDAVPLERSVATGVQEDVEGAQEARQGVHRRREQSDSGNSTGQSKGHGMEGTGGDRGRANEKDDIDKRAGINICFRCRFVFFD